MATARGSKLSDAIYERALQQVGAKPEYAGTYEDQLSSIFDKIQNREKFNYDVNADPLYQSYKDQDIQGGKLAMKDTMGQAAALTGGYGNTYGQQVGQQAYNAYLQNLSTVIPELYGMAYEQYQDEGDQLNDLYGKIGQMRDVEYGRYRDDLGDWETALQRGIENERYERETVRQQEQQDYERRQREEEIARQLENRDYTRRMADEEIRRQEEQTAYNRRTAEEEREYKRQQDAYNRAQAEKETAYKAQQQAYSNLYALIKASGYRPTDDELAAAGMTRAAADALAAEYTRSITPTYSTGSGGNSGSSGSRSSGSGSGGGYGSGSGIIISDSGEASYFDQAIGKAVSEGADAWELNSAIVQNPNLTAEQKRELIDRVMEVAPVNTNIENNHWDYDETLANNRTATYQDKSTGLGYRITLTDDGGKKVTRAPSRDSAEIKKKREEYAYYL